MFHAMSRKENDPVYLVEKSKSSTNLCIKLYCFVEQISVGFLFVQLVGFV